MELHVNGERRRVETDPARSLLSVLRDDFGLTGAKYGCGEGQCGACTVLVNGTARKSCILKMAEAAGKTILTIEGLAQGGKLHPLQQAFLDADAMQCGYCTPGMILTGVALLSQNTKPADPEIVRAMDGNLCRCCAYPRIVAAVRRVRRV